MKISGYSVPTPFGFGGWFAMTKGDGGEDVVMGDLVLTQEEVNPVMSALLDHGLEVTALHNHFFWDEPRVFFMHIHGHGKAVDADHYRRLEDFTVQKMVHSLAVDTATHRVYAPERQENGQPVARMIVYEPVAFQKH